MAVGDLAVASGTLQGVLGRFLRQKECVREGKVVLSGPLGVC